MVIDGYADFVRLQALLRAPSKHAAARNQLVTVAVARIEPKKRGDLGAGEMPNSSSSTELFSDQEDGGNTEGIREERPE